jgi:hypothetical protein
MDPNACWKRFLDACAIDDNFEAFDALCDLTAWLRKGGFPPDGVPPGAVHSLHEWLGGEERDEDQ